MLFNSISYFIFAPLVIGIYYFLPVRFKIVWLFFASLYFYAVFKWIYIFLLIYSIVISYLTIHYIQIYKNHHTRKKFFLIMGIFGNLLILIIFKYLQQFFDIVNLISGRNECDPDYLEPPQILLPMGISFFLLQAISAIVDVYKEKEEKPKNILYFGLYLSFFPQLVAGPILRMQDLMQQFYQKIQFSKENLRNGLFLLTMGFLKKTLIADQISPYVDKVFLTPWEYHSLSMWIAVFLFSIQIYGDFSGYSDIAMGTARIMGFYFPVNFQRPFFATSMREFWNRWHISFSSWLRDYIYIPLGGSKVSSFRVYLNLLITMLISGLWHGAGWNYLLWGSLHGFFLLLERFLSNFHFIKKIKIPDIIGKFYSFWVFSFTFFFFRAKSIIFPNTDFPATPIETGWYMLLRSIIYSPGKLIIPDIHYIVLILILLAFEYHQEKSKENLINKFVNSPLVYIFSIIVLFTSLVIYATTVSQPFVYFQF